MRVSLRSPGSYEAFQMMPCGVENVTTWRLCTDYQESCQVRSGGLHCRADAKTWPPASASAQHRHTSTYEARHWHRPNERARPCTRRRSPNLAAEPPPGPKGSFCCCWLATSLPTPAMGTRPIGVRKEGSARRWEVGKRTVKAVAWGGRSAGAGRTLKVSGRMSKVVLRCAT